MTTKKRARKTEPAGPSAESPATIDRITALSVRLPKPLYDGLRRIVYEEGNIGNRISIHSLILEGVSKVIADRSKRG